MSWCVPRPCLAFMLRGDRSVLLATAIHVHGLLQTCPVHAQGTSPADISQRARALSSSLQQLQSFMAFPSISRRPTIAGAESMIAEEESFPDALAAGLSAMRLSYACSVIEDAFGTDGIGCEPSANQDILRRL